MSKSIDVIRLRKLNFVAGFLHLVQAMAIIWLSKDFKLPISGSYLEFNKLTQSLQPVTKHIFDVSLPILVATFFLICAIAHVSIATFLYKKYSKWLGSGMNLARWVEYSVSASVMMVAISLLVGIYDAMSLLMIFGLVAIMNLLGLVMEIHNQITKRVNWISFLVGCIAGALPWLVIAFYLWFGADNGVKAPDFVYWIFVSIFVFFNCFAINMVLQYKKIGPWKNYLYGELVYAILSFTAKSLLAWQVFAGTLRP